MYKISNYRLWFTKKVFRKSDHHFVQHLLGYYAGDDRPYFLIACRSIPDRSGCF